MTKADLWPADYIRPGLTADHCGDVLGGSYEVPFSPLEAPVILDIGANIGAFARWAATRWPGCTLQCYEPHPDNFALLCRTIKELIPGDARIHAHQQAVLNRSGRALLGPGKFNCGEHSLFIESTPERPAVSVELVSAVDLPRADILKMDAEGAEPIILSELAAAGRLTEFTAIMFEFHSDQAAVQLSGMLEAAGFREVGRNVISQHRGEMKFVRT